MKISLKQILPDFPRLKHLPFKPNTVRGDLIATLEDLDINIENGTTIIEEKVDGANCGMALFEGEPIIRNRDHILRKGYVKDTPAKKQFASIWGWFYEHKEAFEKLNEQMGTVSVYGEWMIQQHGMIYDRLPDWFIAYDVYDWEAGRFLNSYAAREHLEGVGLCVAPCLHGGSFNKTPWTKPFDLEYFAALLDRLTNAKSVFATNALREGIIFKISDERYQTHCFKMVRQGFMQGCLFGEELKRNRLAKS
jgi:hypothetical protein